MSASPRTDRAASSRRHPRQRRHAPRHSATLAGALLVATLLALVILVIGARPSSAAAPTISWTGLGDATSWNDRLNWDALRVPTALDRVAIADVPATSEVQVTTDVTIGELTSAEELRISSPSGGLRLVGADPAARTTRDVHLWSGGALRGGTWTVTPPAQVVVGSSGRLDGVHIVGDVDATDAGTNLYVDNGLVLDGTVRLAYQSHAFFSGNQTVSGHARIELRGGGALAFDGDLTLTESVVVEGAGGSSVGGCIDSICSSGGEPPTARLFNRGTISATPMPAGTGLVPGWGLFLNTALFANTGMARASHDATLMLQPGVDNTGTFDIDGGILQLEGAHDRPSLGTITTSDATVAVRGPLDLAGDELAVDSGSTVLLQGFGTIRDGTVRVPGAAVLQVEGGTMDDLTVVGHTHVKAAHPAFVRNGLRIHGTALVEPTVVFEGSQTLGGPGTMTLVPQYGDSGINVSPGATLTIGAGVTVQGSGRIGGLCDGLTCRDDASIVVNGMLAARPPAPGRHAQLVVDASIVNNGVLASDGGSIMQTAYLQLRKQPANLAGGVLTGGTWRAGPEGRINFPSPAGPIVSIAATVVIDGPRGFLTRGPLSDPTNALQETSRIEPTARLELRRGGGASTAGLLNQGIVAIDPHATLVAPSFTTTGTLEIGVTSGGPSGHADVAGHVALDGALVLVVTDERPGLCESFTAISYGSRSGNFASTTGGDLGDGRRLELALEERAARLYVETARTLAVRDGADSESTGPAVVRLEASAPRSRPIVVTFATADGSARAGSDYEARTGSAVVPTCATTGEIQIGLVDDSGAEPTESFFVDVRDPDGASLASTRATVTIADDDAPAPATTATTSPPQSTSAASASPASRSGYWMVTAGGEVFGFGDSAWLGNAAVGATDAADLEPTPSGAGYWVVDRLGQVYASGDAPWLGNGAALQRGEAVTSISRTPTGRGYWIFTTSGRVFAFGDAPHLGDMAGTRLNGPVLDSIPTPTGRGYYMVASDGGIFTFGDAVFRGSMGGIPLNAPVQSLVPDGDANGYWLVASDGGIFSFDAPFFGSMGGTRLNRPITGMVASGSAGYLMVAEDGGIFSFGTARFHGSLGDRPPARPVTSAAVLP